jgi:hypothetical protein
MTKKSLLGLCSVLLLALLTTTSLYSFAQNAHNLNPRKITPAGSSDLLTQPVGPRITQAIDSRAYVTLTGNTRPEAANTLNYRGPVSAVFPIDHMLLFLQRSPEQEQAVDKLINELNDKNSPNFHKWLTPEEFGERFGVDEQDIQTVSNWLQSQGFQINQVYPNKMVIDFSGTAGQIAEAFRTQMVQLEVNGEAHIANFGDPQIPAALAPVIKGFASLNDFKPHAMHVPISEYTFAGCTSSTAHPTEPGSCYAMTPQDNQTIYNLTPLYNAGYSGQGQTIALVEDTDTYGTAGSGGTSDWTTYRNTFGLTAAFPAGTYTLVHPSCTGPGTNGDDGEAAIDVEVATAIAPSAHIELISCASGTVTFGGLIALQNLINAAGPYPGAVSVSYGVCESFNGNGGNAAFYNTYQQAAAQGISVFTSSGDEGPSGCGRDFSAGANYIVTSLGVSGWGGTPYDVSVGGTDFEDTYNAKFGGPALSTYWNPTNTSGYGSAKQYVPEIPWNDACGSALIAEYVHSSFTTFGSTGFCNVSPGNSTSGYLVAGAGAGGASNCATGNAGTNQSSYGISQPQCQGYPKPSFQTGAALSGGQAVYGVPSDGVRDVPDVSMFAANGVWGHYEIVCWSDPAQTSGGSVSCSGAPSTWAGFGGTSVASPTMAAVQALVNQKTGENWGNPLPYYYQIGQNEYGTAGGTFQGTSCNASGSGGPAGSCIFNDVTQGDIDLACRYNGTVAEHHCYKPSGTNGVTSTDNVTGATVINGGSGYTSAPTCAIAGPSNASPYKAPTGATLFAGGTQAACTAAVNSGTTTAVWTVAMLSTSGVGDTIVLTNPSGSTVCGPYTLSGTTTTLMASGLVTSIGSGCSLATATSSTTTVTITARNPGYAGDFITQFGTATLFNAFYVTITNTTLGQGPNYVSGITITTAGSGYAPETPITLTGGGGSGAIAVANTTPGTASQTYQPSYGAAPGYDLATGLGTPNAASLVNACAWLPSTSPGIFSPAPNSSLTGSSATFSWYPNASASNYWIDVGSTHGGNNYLQSGSLSGNGCALTVNNLPTDGSTIYVTWWYEVGGSWSYTEYQYTAAGGKGVITSPTPGSTLTGSTVTFTWTPGGGDTAYWIDAGSTPGGNQYFQSGNIGNVTSYAVSNLPTNGSTVYITLYSYFNGQWLNNQYTYTAFNASGSQGVLTTPTPGSQFTDSTVTFDWTAGAGASAYWLDIGSTPGGNQYYQSGNLGNVLTVTVNGLPTDGSTVYVTLYSLIGGQWQGTTYTYTAFNSAGALGVMQTPTPGSTLSGSTVTFTWSAGSGATAYWLDVGSTPGGNDIYQSGNLGNVLTTTVNTLPANGSTIYVTLWSYVGGQWLNNQYTYVSGP